MIDKKIGYMISEVASAPSDTSIIEERNNRVTAEVTLQRTNEKNRNGRFYSDTELDPELTCARTIELIKSGNMKGEDGHPLSKDLSRQQTIDPTLTCYKITKLWKNGDLVKAYVRGTQNDLGRDFNNDILDGEKPSFSLRALGTVTNTSKGAEVRNLKIITWDRVIYPSHPGAYMDGIVNESAAIANENFKYEFDDKHSIFLPITNKQVIDYIKQESCNIKTIKESFDTFYDNIIVLENGRKVQLSDNTGNVMIVNVETHIQNEIMNYCNKF